jgi:peptidoglycan LD-endopeptidase CwlK
VASRSLDDLAQPVKAAALALLSACESDGIELLVYCTLRSNAEQSALYVIGRGKAGRIVTNARPGQSMHNPDVDGRSWAFDAVPLIGGKLQWDNPQLMHRVGVLAEGVGLEWAGRWLGSLRESVHFQISRGNHGQGIKSGG